MKISPPFFKEGWPEPKFKIGGKFSFGPGWFVWGFNHPVTEIGIAG
jgi:hypothetical protein